MSYDSANVFAKILRGEIPCKKAYEDDFALAFHDIAPQAPVHVLVIPKGPYSTYGDFIASAAPDEIIGFERAVMATVAELGGLPDGYRLIANTGLNGGQEVPHYHVHILSGRVLGRMVAREG